MNQYAKRGIAAAGASIAAFALAWIPTASADTTLVLSNTTPCSTRWISAGPGDQFVFAGDVFDRPGGVSLGTVGGSCSTLTGNKAGEQACNGTFTLARGQIVLHGVVDTAALFVRGDTVPHSIVGGTGTCQNARGNGTIQVCLPMCRTRPTRTSSST
jgi:hypothetical protein